MYRVLIADDDILMREALHVMIAKDSAFKVVSMTGTGESAVRACKEDVIDIVFMDMQMPVMGGVEATRAIREQERTGGRKPVPIVAMTANAFNEDRERALAAGMDGFMTKPIDLAKLKRILEEYLAKP